MPTIKIITFILDDDPMIVEVFGLLNNPTIFDITYFNNPNEFTAAVNESVHLAILDINIPGYDYDILKTIEYLQTNYPGIYIIVISGMLDVSIMKRFLQLGVFDAVEKGGTVMWISDLEKSLLRVYQKILFKLEAIA